MSLLDEIRAARDRKEGVGPRPLRKRGYHRALKSRRLWALVEEANRTVLNELSRVMYTDQEGDLVIGMRGLAAWLPNCPNTSSNF